jgi:predicted phage tail protein
MLRKIKLYGQLAKFIGSRVLEADVATAAEAVRMLAANFPGLEKHMADQHYRVTVGSYDLTLDEIHDPAGQQDIMIVPVIAGAGAAGRILAGIGLIALSFLLPGAGAFGATSLFGVSAAQGGAFLAGIGTSLSLVGASLILGGVAQLLSPVPTIPQGAGSDNDPRKTFNFSGIQQTSRQGVPVPCVYGLTLVGSVVISAGVDTVQVQALSGTGSPVLDFIFQI